MFPAVYPENIDALKRFCQNKDFNNTKKFINTVWNADAQRNLMMLTNTKNLSELTNWLISQYTKA